LLGFVKHEIGKTHGSAVGVLKPGNARSLNAHGAAVGSDALFISFAKH
jgi:hypothetical protein